MNSHTWTHTLPYPLCAQSKFSNSSFAVQQTCFSSSIALLSMLNYITIKSL